MLHKTAEYVYIFSMSLLMAEQTAYEVLDTIRKGKKPNISKIAIKKGYSVSSATSNKPQKTQAFQRVIAPVVAAMERERARLLKSMADTNLTEVQYHHKADAIDKLTKNSQLLSGGATENVFQISWEAGGEK